MEWKSLKSAREPNPAWNAWSRYGFAVLAVGSGLLLRMCLSVWVGDTLPTYITFYPAVVAAALVAGLGPGLLAVALSVLVVEYWVCTPGDVFRGSSAAEIVGIALFTVMGVFLCILTERYHRVRNQTLLYEQELALRESETRKLRAEQALEQTAEGYRVALEAGQLGTWNYDFLTGEVTWDERCRGLFGVAQGDRIDYDRAISIIHEADREGMDKAVQAALAPGSDGVYEREYRVVWPDGSIRWVVAKGRVHFEGTGGERKPARFSGTVRDNTESRRAQDALRESEEQFRAIFEFASVGIVQADPNTGRLLRFNEKYCEITGYSTEELLKMTFEDLTHPDDRAEDWEMFRRAVRGETPFYRREKRYVRKDGRIIWVRVNAAFIRDAKGQPQRTVAVCDDITAGRETNERLRRSEALYRGIGESIDYGVWVCEPDGRNTYASESFLKLVGVTQEQCSNFGWGDVLHPDDAERTIAAWKECVRTGGHWDMEHRFLGVDGQYHEVLARGVPVKDEQGNVVCWAGINLDISRLKRAEADLARAHAELEQKVETRTARLRQTNQILRNQIRARQQAQRRLKEAEFRYRTVADFTYDWEYWKDPEGALCYCSPACERITGYSAQEFTTAPGLLRDLVFPDDQRIWDAHETAAFHEKGVRELQFRIRNRKGEIRWIDQACRDVVGPSGEFLGIRVSNRDVTERKLGEMELQRLREELNRFSRVTAAGQLAAAIAHEMTQPLGAILCNAQAAENWLAEKPIGTVAAREALQDIQNDCRRAGAVIQRLRSLYQKGSVELVPVAVNEIIRETLGLIDGELEFHGIQVHPNLAEGLWRILGNHVELQQVILNLVMNAIEAMTETEPGNRHLTLATWGEAPGTVRLSVSDSGPGLRPDELSRAFEPFFTTKPTGMGMGLAISRSIVEGNRGRLWVENNNGSGATFHLVLPAILEEKH